MLRRSICLVGLGVLQGLMLPTALWAQATEGAEGLAALEQRLRADPDDLLLGARYRQLAIRHEAYDRSIAFFEQLVEKHPDKANAQLNLGYAYVDKVPVAGVFSRPFLANGSLDAFTRSIEIRPSWLALYTRGNGYLFWPRIFGKADDAVADLRAALRLQKGPPRSYHARAYVALGDGYYKLGELEQARQTWSKGARLLPKDPLLAARLASRGDALEALIDESYVIGRRVDTSLTEMFPAADITSP